MDKRSTSRAIVSLLRGVNVGKRRIEMARLREIYTSIGLERPESFVQSGNVIFGAGRIELDGLAERLSGAIEQSFGFRPEIIFRSVPELREVVANNPFTREQSLEPSKLLVTFLAKDPGEETREKVRAIKIGPEEMHLLSGKSTHFSLTEWDARSCLLRPSRER